MSPIYFVNFLLLVAVAQANEAEDKDMAKGDSMAFATYDIPELPNGKSGGLPLNGNAGYGLPVPPVSSFSTLPAAYAAYLTALGYGGPYGYGYNRYGLMPYSVPGAYGYGSLAYNNLGYGAPVLPGAGYAAGLYGRSAYAGYGYGYPGLAGLGYRYGYGAPALRAPVVPAPVAGVAGPLTGIPGPLPAIPAPLPAAAYKPPVVAQNKDGTLRYGSISVVGQRQPIY